MFAYVVKLEVPNSREGYKNKKKAAFTPPLSHPGHLCLYTPSLSLDPSCFLRAQEHARHTAGAQFNLSSDSG